MKLVAAALFLAALQATDSAPIRIVLPAIVDALVCEEHSFLIGSFGGLGGFARPTRGDHTLQISTANEAGILGRSLKAYVWCPGYEVWTLSLDALPEVHARTITPSLTPRQPVRFTGVVRGWVTPPEPLTLHVNYLPSWNCAFFQLIDCAFGPWPIADVSVNTDGTFAVDLPDVAEDRVIKSFGGEGDFEFTLRDAGWNVIFELKPSGMRPNQRRIAPRATYPAEQAFEFELRS